MLVNTRVSARDTQSALSTMSIYRFRSCILDTRERLLTQNGVPVGLTAKAFDVLQFMAERPGEVLTKDEILGKVWNGQFVEEGNVQVHVSKLRRALGENNGERYIETVTGSGYRFIPPVDTIPANGHTNGPGPLHTAPPHEHVGRDSEAVRYYLKGMHFYENRTISNTYKAIDYFQRSLTYDPSNLSAYIHLILAHKLLFSFDQVPHQETINTIRPILSLVSGFDQENDMLQLMYGEVKSYLYWDLKGAEPQYRKAISINARSSIAYCRLTEILLFMGRIPEALATLSDLRQIEPYSLRANIWTARLYYLMGQFENARIFLKEARELEPNRYEVLLLLGSVLTEVGDFDEAKSVFKAALKDDRDNEALAMLGYLYARRNDKTKAYEVIDRIRTNAPKGRQYNVHLARIHFEIGNKEAGYRLLNRAFENHEGDLVAMNADPRWNAVRQDTEFRRIGDLVGLPT